MQTGLFFFARCEIFERFEDVEDIVEAVVELLAVVESRSDRFVILFSNEPLLSEVFSWLMIHVNDPELKA